MAKILPVSMVQTKNSIPITSLIGMLNHILFTMFVLVNRLPNPKSILFLHPQFLKQTQIMS